MKAWLITWEWDSKSAAMSDLVVGIFNFRWSEKRIEDIMLCIYNLNTCIPSEMMYLAKDRSHKPYKPKYYDDRIIIGGHPYLIARVVTDLSIETDETTDIEIIRWVEPPIYKIHDSQVKMIRGPLPMKFVRLLPGLISFERVWDIHKGDFKNSWRELIINSNNEEYL